MQVHGIRVNRNLEAIDTTPFPIVVTDTVSSFQGLATNGGDFLAAGEHTNSACWDGQQGYIKHVTAGGIVDPPGNGRPLIEAGRDVYPRGAFSAAGADIVLWDEWRDVPTTVAARTSRDGTPLDAEPIAIEEWEAVRAASDGAGLLLLGAGGVHQWRIDGATGAVSSRSFAGDTLIADVAWTGHDFVAVGTHPYIYYDDKVIFLRFTRDGTPIRKITVADGWGRSYPRIVAAGRQAVILWSDWRDDKSLLFAAAVGEDGRVAGPRQIVPAEFFDVASDGKSIFVLVSNRKTVTALRLSPDLAVLDSATLFEGWGVRLAAGRVGDHWLASWMTLQGRVMLAFRSLRPLDGVPVPVRFGGLDVLLLTRPDGSAAAISTGVGERDGKFGVVSGPVMTAREITLVPLRRPAAKR